MNKPDYKDILAVKEKLMGVTPAGTYGPLHSCFELDEIFYELDFANRLTLKGDFADDGIILPTARDMVDAFVDYISIDNARVSVNKKGTANVSAEYAEMMRKFGLGMIYRTNVESDISPWRVAAKHYAMHGMGVFKTVYDASRPDDELPIVVQAINPRCILPDPSYGGRRFIIESHQNMCFDILAKYPKWGNPKNKKAEEEVDFDQYWDRKWRCEMADGEPLPIRGKDVVEHHYDIIPYVIIDSGLGNLSYEAKPEMRYVGLLRYMLDMLVAESMAYSMHHILMKRETLKGGYITGADAETLGEVKQAYGIYTPVGDKDVVFHDWDIKVPPEASFAHLALTHDYITSHGAPDTLRGLSETGVRSGADRRYITGLAAARFKYSIPAFRHGTEKVLQNCAKIAKNVLPKDIRLWSRTNADDDFDIEIKKELMVEPFNFYVDFAPNSEEDEYRRHDDVRAMVHEGIYDDEYAWTQMSNVNPIKMKINKQKAMIRQMPGYLQVMEQYATGKLAEAIAKRGDAEAVMAGQMPLNMQAMGGASPQGNMVAPIPNRAMPGSAQEMQNQIRAGQRPSATMQGQGGGGARGFNR